MDELLPFLKQLISVPGLSGHESPVCDIIEAAWRPLIDEMHYSRLGSLHGVRRGRGAAPRPALLLAAHMDAVGMMVGGLVEGFLRVEAIGGLDPRVLPGQLVTVHGREDLPGVIVQPPAHLLPEDDPDATLEHMLVDTGLPAEQVERVVKLGDLVSFAQPPLELNGGYLAGHSLDNRASVAALTGCLMALKDRELEWDVCAAATAQEELGLAGARTSAFGVQPALAVVVDVTFGRGPGVPAHKTFPLGGGPTLTWGPVNHPALHRKFKDLAERLEIPVQVEFLAGQTGSEADVVQISQSGVPTLLISIPLRNMHTPVEIVSMEDIRRTARLLAEFAVSLNGDTMKEMVWDD
jgi:endoglucanase